MPPLSSNACYNFVFTFNNELLRSGDEIGLQTFTYVPHTWHERVRYCVWQLEQAPETGTYHLQGYFQLSRKARASTLSRAFGCWVRPRRGSHEQAVAYATKPTSRILGPFSYGSASAIEKSGQRSDIKAMVSAVKAGASNLEVLDAFTKQYSRHYRFVEHVRLLLQKRDRPIPSIGILYGPTRTGKSTWVKRHCKGAYWLPQPNSKTGGLWFDGYDGEDTVVIDEFYGWISFSFLLRLLDSTPLVVQTKGGSRYLQASNYVFTSNVHPTAWYTKVPMHRLSALFARLREFGVLYRLPDWTLMSPDTVVLSLSDHSSSDSSQRVFAGPFWEDL